MGGRVSVTVVTSLFLSLFQSVNPSGEGSATGVLLLHSSRSFASTGVRFKMMRSSFAFPDSNIHALLLQYTKYCVACVGHLNTGWHRKKSRTVTYVIWQSSRNESAEKHVCNEQKSSNMSRSSRLKKLPY